MLLVMVLASVGVCLPLASAGAQSVDIVGPSDNPLKTVTPRFTIRAIGFGTARPVQFTLQIATTADFAAGTVLLDSTILSGETDVTMQVTRVLPSAATVYWRAQASTSDGKNATSAVVGPRKLPPWLVLLIPNTGILSSRRPAFVWRSPTLAPEAGEWRFDFELMVNNRDVELAATLLNDTTFIPPFDLQANTSYRWNVRATTRNGQSVREFSSASFLIVDPALPTITLLYQNFPNPFPSASAFATCFWFDVGEPGARISLEVLDLRGNLVRTIIPGDDGVYQFAAGRYGRGIVGLGNNCDNRFVWNGTGNDGRTVPRGAYLLRFAANGGPPTFRTIIFQGR